MRERMICLTGNLISQGDADGVLGWYVPAAFTIEEVGFVGTMSGPSTATVDIQDDGTDITGATAVDIYHATVKRTALTNPVEVAAGSRIEIDLNLNTSSVTGLFSLWGYIGD